MRSLSLGHTGVTDAGLEHLRGLPLTSIDLRSTRVGDAGLVHLKELKELKGFQVELTDAGLPRLSGLDFQAELAKADIRIPIIFMTGHGDIPMTVRAMKAGAVDFLTKPFRDQDMLDAVTTAIERDRVSRDEARMLAGLHARFATLTPREREVMALVTTGLMNKQIAAEIGIAEITVKIHRGHIMRKMAAKSLPDLVRMAEMLGIGPASGGPQT